MPLDSTFWLEFETILADAYRGHEGRNDFNRVIGPALGLHADRDLASDILPMRAVATALGAALRAKDQLIRKAIVAFYVGLPGNAAMRELAMPFLSEEEKALVPGPVFEKERATYEFNRNQETAATGLDVLRENSGDAIIAKILRNSTKMLELAMHTLWIVKSYKQLHDYLHSLQVDTLGGLANILLRTQSDDPSRIEFDDLSKMEITQLIGILPRVVDKMRETAKPLREKRPEFDDTWIEHIAQVFSLLDPVENVDWQRLRKATIEFRSALSRPMWDLNATLIEVARDIPFDLLAELLGTAAGASTGNTADQLLQAETAIRQINAGLNKTIAVHDRWQRLDDALWSFEPLYALAVSDPSQKDVVADQWGGIVAPAKRLAADDPIASDKINMAATAFDAALDLDPPILAALRIAYSSFAKAVRDRFFEVDRNLLDQCTSLVGLEPGLRALIKGLA